VTFFSANHLAQYQIN